MQARLVTCCRHERPSLAYTVVIPTARDSSYGCTGSAHFTPAPVPSHQAEAACDKAMLDALQPAQMASQPQPVLASHCKPGPSPSHSRAASKAFDPASVNAHPTAADRKPQAWPQDVQNGQGSAAAQPFTMSAAHDPTASASTRQLSHAESRQPHTGPAPPQNQQMDTATPSVAELPPRPPSAFAAMAGRALDASGSFNASGSFSRELVNKGSNAGGMALRGWGSSGRHMQSIDSLLSSDRSAGRAAPGQLWGHKQQR